VSNINSKKIGRIFDANFNRAKEGLRVCEDICRFIFDEKKYTRKYKTMRHQLTEIVVAIKLRNVICSRESSKDVGRKSTFAEFKRNGIMDIYYANSQRVKESIRVLEEFMKLAELFGSINFIEAPKDIWHRIEESRFRLARKGYHIQDC